MLVIGVSYFVSGMIPLIPYFFIKDCLTSLYMSSGITLSCLILFGYIKALYLYPSKAIWGSIQSVFVGCLAVITSYGSVYLIEHKNDLFLM